MDTLRLLIAMGTYIQVVTFVISLFTWRKYEHTRLRYLPILLGVNAFIEVFCFNFYPQNNVWLYNLKSAFEFNFLSYIFYGYLGKLSKKIAVGLILVFNFIYLFHFLIHNFWIDLLTYSFVLSSLFFIIIIIMVFNEMLKVDSFLGIQRNLIFWISIAFFIFYATTFPIFSISNLKEILGDFRLQAIYVFLVALFIEQILFIVGFLWSKKKYSY